MIAIIRIAGRVNIRKTVSETLDRLRLRRKYVCVTIDENSDVMMGMLKKVRDFVAFGKINENTLIKLIKERGRKIGKKNSRVENSEIVAKELLAGKKLEALGVKPYFRLHPPLKGINTKRTYPKGVLGNHKDKINELIERML